MFNFNNDTTSSSSSIHTPTLFGFAIPTHRGHDHDDSTPFTYFPYEPVIAAIAVVFFRITVKLQIQHQQSKREEPILFRYLWAISLGVLAYTQQPYQYVVTAELASYMISMIVLYVTSPKQSPTKSTMAVALQSSVTVAMGSVASIIVAYGIVTCVGHPSTQQYFLNYLVPNVVKRAFLYLFPIEEMQKAYTIMEQFMMMEQEFFHHMIHHLFFVTFHIQVGMGYLGIDFLRSEQSRRNQLIRLDVYDDDDDDDAAINGSANGSTGKSMSATDPEPTKMSKKNHKEKQMSEKSRIFQRGAAPFSTYSGVPFGFLLAARCSWYQLTMFLLLLF